MDNRTRSVAHECTQASDEERVTFPEVVKRLMAAGIERYHADLVRAEKSYFMPDGTFETVASKATPGAAPATFSAPAIAAALGAIQAGDIPYLTFCEQIVDAGCVGYHVSFAGRRAVYYGRAGDTYVEWFPGAAPPQSA